MKNYCGQFEFGVKTFWKFRVPDNEVVGLIRFRHILDILSPYPKLEPIVYRRLLLVTNNSRHSGGVTTRKEA